MSKLVAEIIRQYHIDAKLRKTMYELYEIYYESTSFETFNDDLNHKNYVIALWDADKNLQGFSTVAIWDFEFETQAKRAVFSGDTIVHRDYWGEQTLPLAWCRLAGQIKAQAPTEPLYWFLIVKGYRTYRYLPLFAHQFYPTYRYPTPPEMQRLMDYLAEEKFGSDYDPKTGLIRFPVSRGHLRGSWADIKEGYEDKPDVRYFLERNPDYGKGEELVCLMELREDNMRSHARRGFIAGMNSEG
ncbi:hypothetical protein [Laspinema palackyanum]|uniref:hypothetical protein n=1 Tax=Laspinema palackyanum TaxID=3231601 RepID=UPI00345CBEB5|nr:hypothetical protein [Laspinema sp. D2c]